MKTHLDLILILQEYYKTKEPLSDTQIDLYLLGLEDIPVTLLEKAVAHLVRSGHAFMPKVAEIRKAAEGIKMAGKWSIQEEYTLDNLPDDSLLKQMILDGRLRNVNLFAAMYSSKEYWHILALYNDVLAGRLPESVMDARMLKVIGINPDQEYPEPVEVEEVEYALA